MSEVLSRLAPPDGSRKASKRVGRGIGTGLGKTCGRGQKGQKARSTGNIGKRHFQGGQTPMQRRLPKRGFNNPFAAERAEVNVCDLERFASGTVVDESVLLAARLVRKAGLAIKVLGEGELTKSLTVQAHRFSASASEKIGKAGGKVVVLETASASETAESGK
ncbi:MAG TPA: 50S ribosomal protein L15 [Polyangiaceae bacterium]